MVTLILGKTLVFWSGVLAGISFFLMLCTCNFILKFGNFMIKIRTRIHKYLVILTVIFVVIHIVLALLSSLFSIWL